MTDKVTKHESFGLVEISRRQNNFGMALFGSSILHHNTIALKISRAEEVRDLSRNWHHDTERLIEIEFSPTQFIDMITQMNMAPGVPCTIRYVEGKSMSSPPSIEQRQLFEQEFREDMREVSQKIDTALISASRLLEKQTILKCDKQELIELLRQIKQTIESNMPFVQKQFNKAMDKTVSEAKGEVESFITNTIMRLGQEELVKRNTEHLIDNLQSKMPELPDIDRNDDIIDVEETNE